jgi:multidrug efflux pump subunit AcrA (membrane-fusion protein)
MSKFHGGFKRICVLVLVGTMLLTAGCGALFPTEEERLPPPLIETRRIEYITYPAERKTIENTISGYAVVEAANQTNVSVDTNPGGILTAIHFKEGDWVEEGQLLLELKNEHIKESLEETRLRTEIAELRYAKAREQYKNGEMDVVAWKQAELDIYLARRNLKKLEAQLAATQFFSPVTGRIIYRREMTLNAPVGGDVVCTVADTSELVLRYLGNRGEELPLGAICEGVIRNDPSGKVYPLEVIETPLGNTIVKQAVLKSLEPLPEDIELGRQVDIRFVLEKSENTIAVPRRALQTMGSRTYVYVFADGYKQERDVKVGIMSSDEVEILSGITDGDLIIY